MRPAPSPDVLVLGCPGGPRGAAYAASLAGLGITPRFVSYDIVLQGSPLPVRPGTVVRCEAPSDTPGLDAELIRLGGGRPVDVAAGELVPTCAWYAGLAHLLDAVDLALRDAPPHLPMHHAATVLAMFDKADTARRLTTAGVPVPEHLADGSDDCYTTDLAQVQELVDTGWGQAFIKARYGSSGAGIVALRWRGRDEVVSRSTIALDGGRAYNSARLITRHGWAAVARLVEVLRPDGLVVQRWLPKRSIGGGPADLRVVVIGGRARHVLVRVGSGTVTNLHLGARRADVGLARRALGEAVWGRLRRTAEAAVACFDRCMYAGVDLLVTPSGAVHVVEVNAFGDFHEGVVHEGLDTYQAEIVALQADPRLDGSAA